MYEKNLCPLGRAIDNRVKHSKNRKSLTGGYKKNKGIFGKNKSKAPKTILRKAAKAA